MGARSRPALLPGALGALGVLVVVALVVTIGLVGGGPAKRASGGANPEQAAAAAPSITWKSTQRTLGDGRTYFVRGPSCTPARSPTCKDYLSRPRTLVFFLHGATGLEDRDTAFRWLQGMNGWSRETIFVFGVTKNGSGVWNAGICCTTQPVDDVGYLTRILDDVDDRWPVDRRRVGATGLSNGGMLALRATCEHPDVFRAAVALAGMYDQQCDEGKVRIAQWHGSADPTVPLEGGTVNVNGVVRTIPPVVELSQRLAEGSTYELTVIPGRGHSMTWDNHKRATMWLINHLPK